MRVTERQPRAFKSCSHIRFCLEPNPGPMEYSVYVVFNKFLTLMDGCCLAFQWEAGEGESGQ